MPVSIQIESAKDYMPRNDATLANFEELRQRWMPEIERRILATARATTPGGSSLVGMAEYHLSTGGKRLRALIPLAVAESLDVDVERVLGLGAACEILHNATLVHDDLQDGDTVRRGQPTVWVKWGAPQAINLGDAMLYWTLALANEVDFDASAKLRLTQRIVRDTLQVIDGQEREFQLQSAARPSLDDYFRMVVGKTSGLFALPMGGAAELCGASEAVVASLTEAALHLGVVFQLQDDVLDLYGDKGRGHRGSDIGEGKISALVAHCLTHAPSADAEWLSSVLRAPRDEVTADDVERASALFREVGSLAFVLQEIHRRTAQARQAAALQEHPRLLALIDGLTELFLAPIESLASTAS